MPRRLPIYLLMDCSGSVRGDALESVRGAAESLVNAFLSYPPALGCVHLSAIAAFEGKVKLLAPLTPLLDFKLPDFEVGFGGGAALGAALEFLEQQARQEVRKSDKAYQSDFPPWTFILSNGKPADADAYQRMAQRVRKGEVWELQHIVVCTAHKKDGNPLRELTDKALVLDKASAPDVIQYIWDQKFLWESESLSANSDFVFY